jgi:hypothetical protein
MVQRRSGRSAIQSMKLVVLSESPDNEAAIRVLVDGILGTKTDHIAPPYLRTRGWSQLLTVLPGVLKHLHYHTDADALVVVVDSDDSVPHRQNHRLPESASCRLCRLRSLADQVQSDLTRFRIVRRWKLPLYLGRLPEFDKVRSRRSFTRSVATLWS